MNDDGYYYLHTNGSLLYKRFEPESLSPFVCRIWKVDKTNRAGAWTIAIETLALGGNIRDLKEKWGLTDEDAKEFAERTKLKLFKDGNQFCATFDDFINLQESQAGFGDSALEAFADLARQRSCKLS